MARSKICKLVLVIYAVLSVILFIIVCVFVATIDFQSTKDWDHRYDEYIGAIIIFMILFYFVPVMHAYAYTSISRKRWMIAKEMSAQSNLVIQNNYGNRFPQNLNLGNQYQPPVQRNNNQVIYNNIVNPRPAGQNFAPAGGPVGQQVIPDNRPVVHLNREMPASGQPQVSLTKAIPEDMSSHPYLVQKDEETESLLDNDEESKHSHDPYRPGIN
eukprot:CAMPEP_0168355704 /NCGR_PEP_ID=MMETSP0213-20121227/24724_1 /TAXON_ID=151035 /ORGANISM="Euplotes harpa, Strain FSP1.4" /LENGTH=213 /DNA_ID=CAMNT_0008367995 /DNA_START=232 /DNA_END=873 /DNA_ORIENTATION=+